MKAVQSMTAKKSRKSKTNVAERIADGAVSLSPAAQEMAREAIASAIAPTNSAENFDGKAEDSACIPETPAISSDQSAMTPNQTTGEANGPTPTQEKRKVTLTLKGLDKSGRNAVYTGAAISLRFPIGAFENKTPPPNLDMGGVAGPKEKGKPRSQMTKEEQKAARAAQPKLTLAEKVAKAEERLAAQRAKLAKQSEPAAAQPAL